MVEFTVTVPYGTGYGYYINGVQKPVVPIVTGGTFRFNQNHSSNNNHPLILSTTTSTGGIISSGVSYYLDGASNQANYTNTSLFNAATVRYIEITVAQTSDFYYICNVHGSGMGNIMDITGDTWGALGWNVGAWGDQNDQIVTLTGNTLNININGNVSVAIGAQINVTTQLLNLTLESVDPSPDVSLTGIQLTTAIGSVDSSSSVIVTGQQLNLTLNGISVDIVTPVDIGTQLLNLTLSSVDPSPDVEVTGSQIALALGVVGIDSIVVTGNQLNTSMASVTTIANGSVNLTGQQLTTSLNNLSFITNASVDVTGNILTMSQNSINIQSWAIVNTGTTVTWTEINTAA
jgi:hypothetical protein